MLQSVIKHIDEITDKQKHDMFLLMCVYYGNMSEKQFCYDLAKKDKVIMLMDKESLCGFSTQVLLTYTINCKKTNIVFSGDTVIEKQHNNSFALPIAWGRMMLSILDQEPGIPLYWLLTSKGYRTYRYLPVFFYDYFPRPFRVLSFFEQDLLMSIGEHLFNGKLDTQRWIIMSGKKDQYLQPGVADITEARRSKQEIVYFEKKNSGYIHGDELVCLAEFSRENLNPFILKKLLCL
ncbi:hypothetical protein ACFL1F_00815 [Chlamydiota bacterium]